MRSRSSSLLLFFCCSLTRVASLKLEVCTGGACTRNGGALLLDAVAALGCKADGLEVKASACMSKCPNRDVVLRGAGGAMRTVSASGLDSVVSAAAEWLEESGVPVERELREGFAAKVEGEEATTTPTSTPTFTPKPTPRPNPKRSRARRRCEAERRSKRRTASAPPSTPHPPPSPAWSRTRRPRTRLSCGTSRSGTKRRLAGAGC